MEESSEKRRERLQAMRMEASNQSQPFPSSSPSNQSLSNPLMNLAAAGERTPPATRFDFYTDPMAAFSSPKRRHPYSSPTVTSSPAVRSHSSLSYPSNRPSGGPGNYYVHGTQHAGFQFQTIQSPDQTPWRNPIQSQSPFSGHTGGTPPSYAPNPNSLNRSGGGSPGHGFRPNFTSRGRGLPSPSFGQGGSSSPHSNPGRGSGYAGFQFQTIQSPDQTPWRNPIQSQSPFSGHTGGTPPSYAPNPNSLNRSGGGSPGHEFRPNFTTRGRGLPSPSFRHGGSSSPHSNPGRGTGWQFRGSGSSARPGRSGGRGRYSNCSAPYDPYHLCKAVMKDPWRKLKPIAGSILGPKSGSKRAKVFDSGSRSGLSLAESLALSLEEAADDV